MLPGNTQFRVEQTKNAVEVYTLDMTGDLKTLSAGAAVSSTGHSVTHTPPSGGTTTTPTIAKSAGNRVTVTVGPLAYSGTHYVEAIVAYDNANSITKGIWLVILVP